MDKNKPTVSVITTFWNSYEFIITALTSVAAQKTDGFSIEYVIVDDCGDKDSSAALVAGFIGQVSLPGNELYNPGITYKVVRPEHNLGCGGARKFGIAHATGDWFMFLDSDDYYINRDFVSRALNDIRSRHAGIVEYGIIFNNGAGGRVPSCVQRETEVSKAAAELCLFRDNLIKFNVWSKIYTREVVESFPYSDSRTFEDVRTIPVWVMNAPKVVIMPTCEINYRAVDRSIIHEDSVQTRLGTIEAITSLFPKFASDRSILKAMYSRAMVDLEVLLAGHSSENRGFNEMNRLNTEMLSYIFPDRYREFTASEDDLNKDKTKKD